MEYKSYTQTIDGLRYDVYRYYVPVSFDAKLARMRKWFRASEKAVEKRYRRRKNCCELSETAVIILGRIDELMRIDAPLVVGSGYLSSKPWAVFGEAPMAVAKYRFRDFEDIVKHYYNQITRGGANAYYFQFRLTPMLVQTLAAKHQYTTHFIMSLALFLLYDLLDNTGPDCPELFDLFYNDCRLYTMDDAKLDDWRKLRTAAFGKKGLPFLKRHNLPLGQCYDPVPMKSGVSFYEVAKGDLADGEHTVGGMPISYPTFGDYCGAGCRDEMELSLEADAEYEQYLQANSGKLEKYKHLKL